MPGTLGVSDAKNISRSHAALQYESDFMAAEAGPGAWVLTCLGKNGLYHEGQFVAQHSKVAVRHKARIQIGDSILFFIEPQHMDQRT